MSEVRIRNAVAKRKWPRWHFVAFLGEHGQESRGVVDIIAVRKDHSDSGTDGVRKRGDYLQIILIQVKGGSAARPTDEDKARLRVVAQKHGACAVLLGTWKKGKAAEFYSPNSGTGWTKLTDTDLAALLA